MSRHEKVKEWEKDKIRARYKGIGRDELDFIPAKPKEKLFDETNTTKRVCAYCRVSTDDAKQTSSYELQKNHYEDMIREHEGWVLVGIYADEGISGTSLKNRDQFIKMLQDCENGKIDLIVTKSVSRFARNSVDLLANVRRLAAMKNPVGVLFEAEHIYTLDSASEMILAVLSANAQEESRNKSEIMNISIEHRFSRGIFLTPELLGYDHDENGNYVINPDEAKTVELCFFLLLSGYSTKEIAQTLTDLKRPTKLGNTRWSATSVLSVLRNERHCGDVLSRKTYTPNYLDHKTKKNNNDRNSYRKRDHHEAIVSREIFNVAQHMLSSHKYRLKGSVPQLPVITTGVLKGFVLVNRCWTGASGEDYVYASSSVYEGEDDNIKEVHLREINKSKVSQFDFSQFQVVRSQFFSMRENPALTFSCNRFKFNTGCMKRFGNCLFVELLFNPTERLIAVRPCEKEQPNAIAWGNFSSGKWVTKQLSCTAFGTALFELMEWNPEYQYRLRGTRRSFEDQMVMVFDLDEPEIICPHKRESSKKQFPVAEEENQMDSRSKILAYPKEWVDEFGTMFYEHAVSSRLHLIDYFGYWDVMNPGRPTVNYLYKDPEGKENLQMKMDDLLSK